MKLNGQCHCGTVTFEVRFDTPTVVYECNCSICRLQAYQHLIVMKKDFTLISGEENLTEYRFNTRVARHTFCRTCGVKSFYTPRSHPDCVSVNWRSISKDGLGTQASAISMEMFDGVNWEGSVAKLQSLSTKT